MKDFVAIYFESIYIFVTTPDEAEKYAQSNSSDKCIHHYNVQILNLFDQELQLINNKPVIKKIVKCVEKV